MMLTFTLAITPTAKGRPRMTRSGHCYTPEKTRSFESALASAFRSQFKGSPLTGPLSVVIRFILKPPKKPKSIYPIVKPDLDNYAKGAFDAANGIVWKDDSQIVHIDGRKLYAMDGSEPRIEMEVSQLCT